MSLNRYRLLLKGNAQKLQKYHETTEPYLRLPASTWACKLCMSTARPLNWDGLNLLSTTEMCRICCLPPSALASVPSLMPSSTAGTLCAGSMGIGSPCRPCG